VRGDSDVHAEIHPDAASIIRYFTITRHNTGFIEEEPTYVNTCPQALSLQWKENRADRSRARFVNGGAGFGTVGIRELHLLMNTPPQEV